jgi:hypothetical protein
VKLAALRKMGLAPFVVAGICAAGALYADAAWIRVMLVATLAGLYLGVEFIRLLFMQEVRETAEEIEQAVVVMVAANGERQEVLEPTLVLAQELSDILAVSLATLSSHDMHAAATLGERLRDAHAVYTEHV